MSVQWLQPNLDRGESWDLQRFELSGGGGEVGGEGLADSATKLNEPMLFYLISVSILQ